MGPRRLSKVLWVLLSHVVVVCLVQRGHLHFGESHFLFIEDTDVARQHVFLDCAHRTHSRPEPIQILTARDSTTKGSPPLHIFQVTHTRHLVLGIVQLDVNSTMSVISWINQLKGRLAQWNQILLIDTPNKHDLVGLFLVLECFRERNSTSVACTKGKDADRTSVES